MEEPHNDTTWTLFGDDEHLISIPDSPFVDFDNSASLLMDFRAYAMYRPDLTNAIWVPVGCIKWGWDGEVYRDGEGSLVFTDDVDMPSFVGPESVSLPEWTNVFVP